MTSWKPKTTTRKKINQLLNEIRTYSPREYRRSLYELSEIYELDVYVIGRIARSEGLFLKSGYSKYDRIKDVDPFATTVEMLRSEIAYPGEFTEEQDSPIKWGGESGEWCLSSSGEWVLTQERTPIDEGHNDLIAGSSEKRMSVFEIISRASPETIGEISELEMDHYFAEWDFEEPDS